MFENPRRGRQARNFRTNAPKILDLKSSSEQVFSWKLPLGAPDVCNLKTLKHSNSQMRQLYGYVANESSPYEIILSFNRKPDKLKNLFWKFYGNIQYYSLCKGYAQMVAHEHTIHQERNMATPEVMTISETNKTWKCWFYK